MTDLEARVASLAARLQAVEDELAITRLLTSYGFAVDGDDPDACADIYTPDAIATIDDTVTLTGREELRGIVTSEAHQAILPGCAHVMGPFTIYVNGDTATATGYATVYVTEPSGRSVWRQSVGRWTFARTPGGWKVTRRESWARGSAQGQAIARDGVHQVLDENGSAADR
ncbi:MAG TPA: nuclear transport factor 2 family protein [Frankiaceae bacterium]|jgi:ketosteroid isomerase-like protein|nr:nuclear transport factor 2 family protein [Frankiaceae bacterium]